MRKLPEYWSMALSYHRYLSSYTFPGMHISHWNMYDAFLISFSWCYSRCAILNGNSTNLIFLSFSFLWFFFCHSLFNFLSNCHLISHLCRKQRLLTSKLFFMLLLPCSAYLLRAWSYFFWRNRSSFMQCIVSLCQIIHSIKYSASKGKDQIKNG